MGSPLNNNPGKPDDSGNSRRTPVFLIIYGIVCLVTVPVLLFKLTASHHAPALNPYYSEAVNYPPGGTWRAALAAFLVTSLFYLIADHFLFHRLQSWKRTLATALSVIFILAGMETAIRYFTIKNPPLHRPSPLYLWRLYPDHKGMADLGDGRVRSIRVNHMGFRGEEITTEKPPGTYRIIILGDSAMFGYGIDQEETSSTLLRSELQKMAPDGVKIQVINMAVMGYTTFSSRRLFHDAGIRLKPDLVIIAHNNDPDIDWAPDSSRAMKGPGLAMAKILYKSDLYLLLRKYVLNFKIKNSNQANSIPPSSLGVPRVSQEEMKENLRGIIADANSEGARVMIVSMPRREEGGPALNRYWEIIKTGETGERVFFVDLYNRWSEPEEELFIDPVHPSPPGHQRLARELAMEIAPYLPGESVKK